MLALKLPPKTINKASVAGVHAHERSSLINDDDVDDDDVDVAVDVDDVLRLVKVVMTEMTTVMMTNGNDWCIGL